MQNNPSLVLDPGPKAPSLKAKLGALSSIPLMLAVMALNAPVAMAAEHEFLDSLETGSSSVTEMGTITELFMAVGELGLYYVAPAIGVVLGIVGLTRINRRDWGGAMAAGGSAIALFLAPFILDGAFAYFST